MLQSNGIEASIRAGDNGQYDVVRDGQIVFSKKAEGRFPEEDEILGLLR